MDKPSPEFELGQWFCTGEDAAVRAVYDRFGGAVHTVVFSMLGDRQLAAEAVQMTFLKAWQGVAGYDPKRPLAPWLYAIARRVAVDLRRHESVRPSLVAGEGVEQGEDPEDFERTWELWEIRSALDQLEPDESAIVRLSHFAGLSHAEIAGRLRLPIGTVKSRSHRAHRKLARLLAHLIDGDRALMATADRLIRAKP